MLIVVAFLVLNFCNVLIITRSHELGFARNLVEMNPTSPPELSKQLRDLRDLRNSQKTKQIKNYCFLLEKK